jgi:hypothetical protein
MTRRAQPVPRLDPDIARLAGALADRIGAAIADLALAQKWVVRGRDEHATRRAAAASPRSAHLVREALRILAICARRQRRAADHHHQASAWRPNVPPLLALPYTWASRVPLWPAANTPAGEILAASFQNACV